jgi:hypothetical protein
VEAFSFIFWDEKGGGEGRGKERESGRVESDDSELGTICLSRPPNSK